MEKRSVRTSVSSIRRRKILAILAGGAVLGVGTAATLATWNDNEWIVAGVDNEPGIGTSTFDVWQNRDQSPTNASTWSEHATSAEAGALVFTSGALSLTPGDSVYAPVAIQTKANSIAGTVTLQAPVTSAIPADDPDDELWNALEYSVKVSETARNCTAATWSEFGADVVTASSFNDALNADAQSLAADRGNTQYYCFEITLPPNTPPADPSAMNVLQGRSVAPAWQFIAESTT